MRGRRFNRPALAAALAAAVTVRCSRAAPPPPPPAALTPAQLSAQVTLGAVQQRAVDQRVITSARLVFDENRLAHVFSPVTGRVTRIVAQLGEAVKRGQVLAVVSSPDLGNASADLGKAQPAVVQTGKELARQKELYAAHAGPLRDLEAAQSAFDQAEAERERAAARLRLLMERARTSQVSQEFPLLAPIDGQIVARQINPGAEVQGQYSGGATQELYTIGRQDSLWVMTDVYEQDVARVHVGAAVQVRVVAYPDRAFAGRIDWISDTLDPVTRTMAVRCTLDNPEHLLKAQMYATVAIEAAAPSRLAVPRASVLHFGRTTVVIGLSADGKQFVRIPVTVDEEASGDWVAVQHGLSEGDRIVTAGALLISETLP